MKFFKQAKEIEKEEEKEEIPVEKEKIENLIKILDVAQEINAPFELCLKLKIGDFQISSNSFQGMRILKENKTEPERIIVSYKDVLLGIDTTINIENIVGIECTVSFVS